MGFLGKEQLSFKPIWTQTGTTFLSRKYIRKDKKVRACCSEKHAKKADKPLLMHLTFFFLHCASSEMTFEQNHN